MELEWHPVAGANHAFLRITPRNQAAYKNDPRFANIDEQGRIYATLGAGPEPMGAIGMFRSGRLKSDYNRERDVRPYQRGITVAPPNSMIEGQFINRLFKADRDYADDLPYEAFPDPQTMGRFGSRITASYNSNSYVPGLLRAIGVVPPGAPAPGCPDIASPCRRGISAGRRVPAETCRAPVSSQSTTGMTGLLPIVANPGIRDAIRRCCSSSMGEPSRDPDVGVGDVCNCGLLPALNRRDHVGNRVPVFAPFAFVYNLALLAGFTDEFLSGIPGLLTQLTLALACYVVLDYGVMRGVDAYRAAVRKRRGQDEPQSTAGMPTSGAGELCLEGVSGAATLSLGERVLIWVGRHPVIVWALLVCLMVPPLILLRVTYDAGGLWALLYYLGGLICIPFFAFMRIVDAIGIDSTAPVPFLITLLVFFVLCPAVDLKLDRWRLARKKAAAGQGATRP